MSWQCTQLIQAKCYSFYWMENRKYIFNGLATDVMATKICLFVSLNICIGIFSVIDHCFQAFYSAVYLTVLKCNYELTIFCVWRGLKISTILDHFHCMFGNTAKAWSYCSSRWYRCCECGSVIVCVELAWHKNDYFTGGLHQGKQHAFLPPGRNERGRDPLTTGCHVWTELFATVKCVEEDHNV